MNRFGSRITALVGITAMMFSVAPSLPVFAYQDGNNTYEWKDEKITVDGTDKYLKFWYENGVKQGVYVSVGNVWYDGSERGREIYDRSSDGWYWLDAVYSGAKASSKEVFMPYIYNNEALSRSDYGWVISMAALSNKTAEDVERDGGEVVDLSAQVKKAIEEGTGKWVRYDGDGKMIKGWYRVKGDIDEYLYPSQKGNIYYYDRQTGLMAKGTVVIDGVTYTFDETTGKLLSGQVPDDAFDNIRKIYTEEDKTITVDGITRLDNSVFHYSNDAKELSKDIKIGDAVKFRSYEQDNDLKNGQEAIEWEVLDIADGKALFISRYVLDSKYYNDRSEKVTWETCTLRKWMNEDFYNAAFSEEEKAKIALTELKQMDNPHKDGGKGGNDTLDKVFCLGCDEIEKYYGFNIGRIEYEKLYNPYFNSKSLDADVNYGGYSRQLLTDATPYAEKEFNGIYEFIPSDYENSLRKYGYSEEVIGKSPADWVLRTPGFDIFEYGMGYGNMEVITVSSEGAESIYDCSNVDTLYGIRPAIWVEL